MRISNILFRQLAVLTFGAILAVNGAVAGAAGKTSLTLGSTNMTSSHFVVSNAMAKAIEQGMPGTTVTHVETGASVDNIRRLARGELDLGLVATDAGIQAVTGTGAFKGKKVDDLVALYAYDVSALNVAVTQASKISDLAGLQGKRFNPGIHGSGAEQLTRQIFKALDISPNWVPGTVKDAAEAIQNRQIVGYSKYGPGHGIDATLRELMVTTPMRLLPFSQQEQDKVVGAVKGVGFTEISNVMDGVAPVMAPSVLIVYATRTSLMDDDTAYAIAKSIYEHRDLLIQAWPHLKNFDFKKQALAAEKLGIPLHPGALRFWKSVE